MPTRKAPYPAEFRQQMAELVHVGRTPSQLVREVDVTAQSISRWVAQAAGESRHWCHFTKVDRTEARMVA